MKDYTGIAVITIFAMGMIVGITICQLFQKPKLTYYKIEDPKPEEETRISQVINDTMFNDSIVREPWKGGGGEFIITGNKIGLVIYPKYD